MNIAGEKELIIPTYDTVNQKACTAILNMETFEWNSLTNDGRGPEVTEEVDAHVISDEKLDYIFYLGGTIGYEFVKSRTPFKSVYRFDYSGWVKLESSFSALNGEIPVPLKFYWTNNWAKLDANQLSSRSKLELSHSICTNEIWLKIFNQISLVELSHKALFVSVWTISIMRCTVNFDPKLALKVEPFRVISPCKKECELMPNCK